jgi:ABC-2 type transport system ATP-binding protein
MSLVEIRNLTKTYGPIEAVDDLSIAFDKGEIVALVGPDGAGKTTTFRATCGLIDFDSGRITVAGLDVSRQFSKVKCHLGYMPQVFSLYPDLSVAENLEFYAGIFGVGRKEYAQKREALYAFSGLGPFAGRRAGALSGGMKQKLSLSCALVHDPDVLILDEPTTGVDPVSRQQFWAILKDLRKRGSAIAIATPYMDEVALSDRAVFMYEGKTLGSGSPAELLSQFGGRVYRIGEALPPDTFDALAGIEGLDSRRLGPAAYIYTRPGDDLAAHLPELEAIGLSGDRIEEAAPNLEDVFIEMMNK